MQYQETMSSDEKLAIAIKSIELEKPEIKKEQAIC
jgi:hypothetical protein